MKMISAFKNPNHTQGGNQMKVIATPNAPQAIGPYSQAIEANRTLYISGQIPLDPQTMEFVSDEIEAQAHQCLKNIQAILTEAGYGLENVVKCGIFLADMNDFVVVNTLNINLLVLVFKWLVYHVMPKSKLKQLLLNNLKGTVKRFLFWFCG